MTVIASWIAFCDIQDHLVKRFLPILAYLGDTAGSLQDHNNKVNITKVESDEFFGVPYKNYVYAIL